MAMDLSVEMIHATVQLEQPLGDGTRTVGTGFLISAPGPDGTPRTILITANHVLQKMPGADARIGYRVENADGSWTYSPQVIHIRDRGGRELPVAADFVAAQTTLAEGQQLVLHRAEDGALFLTVDHA